MTDNDDLKIEQQEKNGEVIFKVIGDLIITNAQNLQKKIDEVINDEVKNIVFDFSEIQYVDSFGIGVIVKTKADVDKKRGTLKIFANDSFYKDLKKCHLDEYITIELKN